MPALQISWKLNKFVAMANSRFKELKYNLVLAACSSLLIGLHFGIREHAPCNNCWYYLASVLAIYLYLALAMFLSLKRANRCQSLSGKSFLQCFAYPLRTFMLITLLNIAVHLLCASWIYPHLRTELKAQYVQMVTEKAKSDTEKYEKIAQFPWLFIVYFAQQILFYNTLIAIPSSFLAILIFRRKYA